MSKPKKNKVCGELITPLNPQDKSVIINAKVIVTTKNDMPCIELRKTTTDLNQIKQIVRATLHAQPILLSVEFSEPFKSWAQLHEKGIVYCDKEGKPYFVIEDE